MLKVSCSGQKTIAMYFEDRHDAGRQLADALQHYREMPAMLVLGLPRGGVPVAWEIARSLGAELDTLVVRKLGVPWQPEVAMGAIAGNGVCVLHHDLVARLNIADQDVDDIVSQETKELQRREMAYRAGRATLDVSGRTVIVVDDGLATGATMRAALEALREQRPARLIVAVPVAPPDTVAQLAPLADDVICLSQPPHFGAVGQWYRHFDQTSDDEVLRLLASSSE
ncbi:phosphoribosyltransferase [Aidingimonas halophila]|uniref:Predicted phosphoribosyltransferase n=1 Tax=Aidingimonas halophila TaxID=574349 RepID=A0A1H3D331_9GAMM|nr:phosphoribosyltransferase [Aidingimonas halophila]GHC30636.1 phosphoribosyltransferase [Aidingimonas halophila]SDX60538.1 Predicted phosphoribosyltransferase [Aidingimonas halophila]